MKKTNKRILGIIILGLFVILMKFDGNHTQEIKTEEKVSHNGDYFAILLDNKPVTTIPDAGTYLVDYVCDNNSEITWNRQTGELSLSKNKSVTESCTLNFKTNPLVSDLKQGDYILYEGNNGCKRNGVATAAINTTGVTDVENDNSCLGYNANANSDGSKDSTNGMYGYCYSSNYRYYVSGWRIAYTEDDRAYIISAGSPECNPKDNTGAGNVGYIKDANSKAKKYCNNNFVDDCTSDTEVHAINDTDFNKMTAQMTETTGGYLYTNMMSANKCGSVGYNEVCGYKNDLLSNGGYYWFAAPYTETSNNGVYWYPSGRSVSSRADTSAYGLRPVVRLSSSVYVTGGSGTMDDPYVINHYVFKFNNNNTGYTTNSEIELSLYGTGVSQMCISNTKTCTDYEVFSLTKTWSLSPGDGEKTVYVYYKDADGNIVASLSRDIILDTILPSNNSVQISSGDSIQRTLTLSSMGADYMCFSNTSSSVSDCTNWVDYESTYTWYLTAGSGNKTVYAFFKDKAGNVASASSGTICNDCSVITVSEDFSDTIYDSNLTISGSGDYPWVVNNARFESTNSEQDNTSSISTITFTPNADVKLSFDYGVSSEYYSEFLTIILTGSDSSNKVLVGENSGQVSSSISDISLSAGVTYTLTLIYTKDFGFYDLDDLAYIDNLYIGP